MFSVFVGLSKVSQVFGSIQRLSRVSSVFTVLFRCFKVLSKALWDRFFGVFKVAFLTLCKVGLGVFDFFHFSAVVAVCLRSSFRHLSQSVSQVTESINKG